MEELRRAQLKSQQRRRYITIGGAVAIFAVAFFLLTRHSSSKKNVATSTSTTVPGATTTPGATTAAANLAVAVLPAPANSPCPKADGSSPHYTKFTAAPPNCLDPAKTYTATMQTDVGNITIKLDPKKAPMAANSFVYLAGYHFFDGIVFHRVIPGFVDQGGDPTGTGTGGPGYQFADELPQPGDYKAGSLAMANSGPNTNGSQFFLLVSDAAGQQLVQAVGGKASYSLYGQVTAGLDIVTKINNDGDASGTPKVQHKMVKVTVAAS
jgi:cyclophilin family peptidyl-prolyl cis-trans isomerase